MKICYLFHVSMYLDAEEAWIMQTSSGYEDDFFYEDAIRTDIRDTNEGRGATEPVTKETALPRGKVCEVNQNVQKNNTAETESREEKIKSLKALLRKQEKAVNKLKSDTHKTTQTPSSVAASRFKSKTNPAAKGSSRGGLGTKTRRGRKRKIECSDIVTSSRDVDIWMSRGDLITKDEFLAVVGLVRVAKFH